MSEFRQDIRAAMHKGLEGVESPDRSRETQEASEAVAKRLQGAVWPEKAVEVKRQMAMGGDETVYIY